MASYYMWMKAVHIVSILVWMGGLLFFPWILFYQGRESGSEALVAIGKTAMRGLINPAAVLALVTGVLLIIVTGAGAPGSGGWMHLKIVFILMIGALHGMLSKHRRLSEQGESPKPPSYFRALFFILLALTTAVVFTVVMKPF
jgi:putative membrane protein